MKKNWNFYIIGFLAFFFRILFLSHQSLWMDEGFSVWMAAHPVSDLMRLIRYDAHPLGFYLFLHYWMKLGNSVFFLRLPSVVCRVVSCLAVYSIGRELLGERAGAASAVFWTCSMTALNSDTDIRMYAYATCFSLISTFWLWRAYKYGGRKNWIFYYLFAALSLYTHYYTGFIIMAQWLFLLTEKRWEESVWVPLILTLIFSPWTFIFFLQFFHAIDKGMPRATWHASFHFFAEFLGAKRYFSGKPLLINLSSIFSIGVLVYALFALVKRRKEEGVFLLLLFGIPFCVPFMISHFSSRHIFIFRYAILFAPYFVLLFTYGLFSLPKPAAYPIYGSIIFMNLSIWFLFLTSPAFQRQNWREAVKIMSAQMKDVQGYFCGV
jgi:uncharacterized membrane protein